MHEHQVEVMKSFYEQNKHLFKLVEKRATMFAKMQEMEVTSISLFYINQSDKIFSITRQRDNDILLGFPIANKVFHFKHYSDNKEMYTEQTKRSFNTEILEKTNKIVN